MATQQTTAGKGRTPSRAQPSRPQSSRPASATEERDEVYGLVSVLYHALQGAETYARYVEDARRAGDGELIEFFEECQDEEVDRADRAKELLATRLDAFLGGSDEAEDEDDDEDDDDEDEEVELSEKR